LEQQARFYQNRAGLFVEYEIKGKKPGNSIFYPNIPYEISLDNDFLCPGSV